MVTLAVNGQRVCVPPDVQPSTRLIEVLRSDTRFRGPKLACGEGGCGACAVLCERFDPLTGKVTRCTLNSCLAPIGSLDGASITTSEGLGNSKDGFHPIQDALAKNFASQCGFCTPGIAVALAAAAAGGGGSGGDSTGGLQASSCPGHSDATTAATAAGAGAGAGCVSPSAVSLAQGLDGNLCRCTGWRPIIDACRDIADMEDLCSSSKTACCKDTNGSCKGSAACSSRIKCGLPQLLPFPDWLKQHVTDQYQQQQQHWQQQQQWQQMAPGSTLLQQQQHPHQQQQSGHQTWLSPTSLQQLSDMLRSCGGRAHLVAGNTGAGVYKELWCHDSPVIISPHCVTEMTSISHQAHGVILGGALTIQQLLQELRAPPAAAAAAATADTLGLQAAAGATAGGVCGGGVRCAPSSTVKAWGVMADHIERIAGAHVRSAATLGGHFGLCASRPLPTDLGLLLAAAGAQLQVMTVDTHNQRAYTHAQQQQQQQQWQQWGTYAEQQQQLPLFVKQSTQCEGLDLKWMSVEDFLAGSAVGGNTAAHQQQQQQQPVAAAAAGGPAEQQFITADAIAGAVLLPVQPRAQQEPVSTLNTAAAGSSSSSIRVVTAVWLPYAADSSERFWSYKLSWRHVNSHAFVNAAVWMRFDDTTHNINNSSSSDNSSSSSSKGAATDVHSSSSSSVGSSAGGAVGGEKVDELFSVLTGQSDPLFVGRRVSAVRVFVGCPPAPTNTSIGPNTAAAAGHNTAAAGGCSAVAAAAAGVQSAAAGDDGGWCVLRLACVEDVLLGTAVTVQVLIAALKQLEVTLHDRVGVTPHNFTSQALQGLLFKALVPLLDTQHITQQQQQQLPLLQQQQGDDVRGGSGRGGGGSVSGSGVSKDLLRLLQLPAAYDPRVLPSGRQVLPTPPPGQQQQQAQQQCAATSQQVLQQQEVKARQLHTTINCHPRPHNTNTDPANSSSSSSSSDCPTAAKVCGRVPAGPEVGQAGAAGPMPLHLPVEKEDVWLQASGEAQYCADVAARLGRGTTLYLAGVRSSRALAKLVCVDASAALDLTGVVACITAADIPGCNSVFGAPLLAAGEVEYVGQLIALVAATTQTAADRAAQLVSVTYDDIPGHTPIITLDQAIAAGAFYDTPAAATLKAEAVRPPSPDAAAAEEEGLVPSSCQGNGAPAAEEKSLQQQQQEQQCAPSGCEVCQPHVSPTTGVSVSALIAAAPLRLTGQYELPAQQHMYMETQTAVAEPREGGGLVVWSATQSLDAVQQAVADVLGLSFNQVAVVTHRLGGGFGGKASRSMPVAAAAALVASLLQRPVCYSLNRNEDFAANAGRCAGRVAYEAGFRPDGKIVAIQAKVIFRAGAHLDLASNDGAALLAASDSAYDLSGLSVEVKFARCNLPPHTIMRGPGYLQGCMVMEQILEHVAAVLGKDSSEVKAANFLPETSSQPATTNSTSTAAGSNDSLSGKLCNTHIEQQLSSSSSSSDCSLDDGAVPSPAAVGGVVTALGRFIPAASYTLPRLWRELLQTSGYAARLQAVQQHNATHAWSKRGIVVTPVRFDCAPAAVSASLCVYADGSVLVHHGGVEMGQGLATKVKQAAVAALSELLPQHQRPLPLHLVRLAASSSCVNPNAGPTWSSTGSEGNCQAVMDAAAQVVERLRPQLKVGQDALSTWQATIAAQFTDVGFAPAGVMLSAYGYFDGTVPSNDNNTHNTGSSQGTNSRSSRGGGRAGGGAAARQAVQYSAFGAAVTEVELDVLTGERRVLSTHIAYDCGYSLNPRIDLGQVEGAFVMGLGAMLCEEVVVDPSSGKLLSDSTWTYKIPTPDLIPQHFTVSFLSDAPNPAGIAGSKASGEPALMTATSALLALQQAVTAAAEEVQQLQPAPGACGVGSCGGGVVRQEGGWRVLAAPATPQRVKGVVGPFSIADALQAALGARM